MLACPLVAPEVIIHNDILRNDISCMYIYIFAEIVLGKSISCIYYHPKSLNF